MSMFGGRKTRRIENLIQQAAEMPFGPEERAVLDEAVRLADEAGADELAYRARIHLTTSAHNAGDTDAMIASFGWCVGKHDSDPVRFPIDIGAHVDLLFQYKWMAARLASNARFPRERVTSVHEDMERRYRAAGIGQSGVLQSKHDVAMLLGDIEAATRYQAERDAVERDEYSHCEACVRSIDANFAQILGDDERALALWGEMLEQNLQCGEEPERAESEALLPLLRAGRFDEAVAAHARSYRAARLNPDGFGMIANHLIFCALTGNLARGLQLLERHIGILAHEPYNQASHFEGLTALGVLLDVVVEAGEGATIVRGSDDPTLEGPLGATDAPRTAEQLRDAAWSAAAQLAAGFDERNGNDYFTTRLRERRALGDTRYDVPFGGETFTPTVVASAEPTDAWGWAGAGTMRLVADDPSGVAAAVARGLAFDDRRVTPVLLRLLVSVEVARDAKESAQERLDDYVAALRTAGWDEFADVSARLELSHLMNDDADVVALTAEADRAEDGSLAAKLHGRVAGAHWRNGDPEATLAAFEAAASRLPQDDPHGLAPRVIGGLAMALSAVGRLEEAIAVAQSPLEDERYAHWPLSHLLRIVTVSSAQLGQFDAALTAVERLWTETLQLDVAAEIAECARLTAMILSDLDRDDEAAARAEFAITQFERAGLSTTEMRLMLARYQLNAGQASLALENAETAYLAEQEAGLSGQELAITGILVGEAALAADEPGLAYRAWTEAVELAQNDDDRETASRAGLALGNLMLRYSDSDAVQVFATALADARAAEPKGPIPPLLHGLGRARVAADDAGGLDDLDEAIAIARAEGATWFAANVLDSKGGCLIELGRLDEGLSLTLAAADELVAEGDIMTAGMGEVNAARALAEADRGDEAAAVFQTARDRFPEGSPPFIGISLELADVLDQLGRGEEAGRLRASVTS